MIPVFQTRFGGIDAPYDEQGNCLAACIASILHCRIEDVDAHPKDNAPWLSAFQNKLRPLNYQLIILQPECAKALLSDTYYIASGLSPRGNWHHSVVYQNEKLMHDPVPDGVGLVNGKSVKGLSGPVTDVMVLVWKS